MNDGILDTEMEAERQKLEAKITLALKVDENRLKLIKILETAKVVMPHNSYDGGCCMGTNESVRNELIQELKNLEY